jgi:hypothetical protein
MMTESKAALAVLKRTSALLLCGAVLTGCSYIMGPPDTRPPQPAPEPLPAARQIIANSTDTLFDASANPKNVVISEVRRLDSALGAEFGVCLRASVADRSGKYHPATYVVFVSKNRITDRRKARPADECDRETYRPL